MATNSINTNNLGLSQAQQAQSSVKKDDQIGGTDFLKLLVTQLKNQDPESPQDPSQFAVQLSQFASTEQLVSINKKLDTLGGDQLSSLSSYLGNQVVLDTDKVSVEAGDGGYLGVKLPSNADSLEISLLNPDGTVKETVTTGAATAGNQILDLSGLSTQFGDYDFKVVANIGSERLDLNAEVVGVVSGFVPGPNPELLIGNRHVGLGDIKEVRIAGAK